MLIGINSPSQFEDIREFLISGETKHSFGWSSNFLEVSILPSKLDLKYSLKETKKSILEMWERLHIIDFAF